MLHSGTIGFLNYWQSLQISPDHAPERARFDPAQLKPIVRQMIMLSATEKGLPFRLAGEFSGQLHGRDLKNTAFLSLFRDTFHIPLLAAMRQSLRSARPLVLKVESEWTRPHAPIRPEAVSLEISLCPLMASDGRVDRFVGMYQTTSAQPRTQGGQLGPLRLTSSRLIEPLRTVRPAHLQLISLEGRRIA